MDATTVGLFWDIVVGTSLLLALVTAFIVIIIYHNKTRIRLEQEKKSAVQKTELRYKELFENIFDIVYVHDANGKILEINHTITAALGYGPEDFSGRNISGFFLPRYRREIPGYLARALRPGTETVGIVPLLSKSRDRVMMLEYKSSPVMDGGRVVAVRGIARNITERVRHEHQLRRSKEKIALLLVRAESAREKLAELSRTTIRMQEDDRKWISHELHDEIGQILASILMNLELLRKESATDDLRALDVIGELREITNGVLRKIRGFLQTIRPVPVGDGGLSAALDALVADFSSRSGIQVSFQKNSDAELLDNDQKVSLYRIVQESLTNIYKHAEATGASIVLRRDGNRLTLEITDTGKGFDATRPEKTSGLGHVGMRERAILARGTLNIESSPGAGTRIRVAMPLNGTKEDA